jgi:hypothetical protein
MRRRESELFGALRAADAERPAPRASRPRRLRRGALRVVVHHPREQSASRLPQLTPMRTGLPYSIAFSIITANCGSRFEPLPTLPGLMRYFASAARSPGTR